MKLKGALLSVFIYSPSQNIWGGGQIYIDSLCRFLNDKGIKTIIVTSEPQTFSSPALRMASVSCKIRRFTSAFSLAKRLKRKGGKVVVLNDLSSLWLAPIFRLFGFKVVSLLHLYLQPKNEAGFGHSRLEIHALRFSSRFAHRIYSVNKENLRSFPVRVQWVGNFIPRWFFEVERTKAKCYDLGLVARLSEEKNIPLFIELVANLNKFADRRVNALIVGKGEQESLVRREIQRFGMEALIEIKPWLDRADLPSVFDQFRCFAVTSYHEGFATTLLESHARGVPAISTRSAGFCPEFLQNFGEVTGLVFDPDEISSDSFLGAVMQLVDSSDEHFEACTAKALKFSEETVLGSLYSGVLELIPNKNGAVLK